MEKRYQIQIDFFHFILSLEFGWTPTFLTEGEFDCIKKSSASLQPLIFSKLMGFIFELIKMTKGETSSDKTLNQLLKKFRLFLL